MEEKTTYLPQVTPLYTGHHSVTPMVWLSVFLVEDRMVTSVKGSNLCQVSGFLIHSSTNKTDCHTTGVTEW
jgi:hypothetical protein